MAAESNIKTATFGPLMSSSPHYKSPDRGIVDAHELNWIEQVSRRRRSTAGTLAELRNVGRALVDREIAKGREADADVFQIGAGG